MRFFKGVFVLPLVVLLCSCGAKATYEYHNNIGLQLSLVQGDKYTAQLRLDVKNQDNTPITSLQFEDGIMDMLQFTEEALAAISQNVSRSLSYNIMESLPASETSLLLSFDCTAPIVGQELKLQIPSITLNGARHEGPWEVSLKLDVDNRSQWYTLDPAAVGIGPLTAIEVEACPYSVQVRTPGATQGLADREIFITLHSGRTPRSDSGSFSSDPAEPRFFHYIHAIDHDQLASITIDGVEYPLVPLK